MLRAILFPFWNASERRVRAPWRLAIQLVVMFGPMPLAAWAFAFAQTLPLPDAAEAGVWIAVCNVVVLSVWGCARFLDKRPLRSLGLRGGFGWWIDAAFGFALGALLMVGIATTEILSGWGRYGLRSDSSPSWIAVAFVVFVVVAIDEELVCRGYQLTNLAEGLTFGRLGRSGAALVATLISSAAFGIAHVVNPHATLESTANIVLAGMMLAAGYVCTGQLAIPLGLHLGWNFFQNLFGMPVSGQSDYFYGALLVRAENGPDWATGGAFGPEGGITGGLATVLGTLCILAWVRARQGKLRIVDLGRTVS